MQTRTSISHKLILYIFLLGIFVIVSVSLYSFITTRNALLERTFNQLISLREAKKEQVEQFINFRLQEIKLFANTIRATEFVAKGSTELEFNPTLSNHFTEILSSNHYQNVTFASAASNKLFTMNAKDFSLSKTDSSMAELIKPIVADCRNNRQGRIYDYKVLQTDSTVHLFIAFPAFNRENKVAAVFIFELSTEALNQILLHRDASKGMGKSGEVYLVGPDSLFRSESRFIKNAVLKTQVHTQTLRSAFINHEGSGITKDYRGVSTLSSYSRLNIEGLNWVILAEIDKKEAMRPVYKLANEIVFLSIFITLILFIASYVISQRIANPIIELKNATIKIGEGDFDQTLPINSNDEIGELTRNFNQMAGQLKQQQIELKERETRMFTSFIDGQEDERQRLSRELHDGLGQLIVATKLKTESIINQKNSINSENMLRLRSMFDNLVDEVRSISNNLMPAVLKEFGIEIALNQICKDIAAHSNINVIFDSQITTENLDKRIATYVFRIAQEALNNAVKHANATEIIVSLIDNPRILNLMVQDNGIGINLEDPCNKNGRGLNSMCERVKLLNGIMDISKGEERGTIVSVKIPLVNAIDK